MKKKSLLVMALLGASALGSPMMTVAQTVPPSASTTIYNFDPFSDSNMLTLFYEVLQKGKKFPTLAEFEAKGFSKHDLEFVRSHVRPRVVMIDKNEQLLNSLYPKRKLWMNIPSGDGKTLGGFPNSNFSDDTYSMWNYTAVFGNWNHGLFQGPGAWADAAHKNGTDIYSGIKFFEHWTPGSGDQAYSKLITEKDAQGNFKYVEPLINILLYFGTDGINYNWEDASYSDPDVLAFHRALYQKADEVGFKNFHIGLYTSISSLTESNTAVMYGSKATGKVSDVFLNYAASDFDGSLGNSVLAAEKVYGDADGVYQGAWIVSMNRSWHYFTQGGEYDYTPAAKAAAQRMNMVLWGEHSNSRFWSYNTGGDAYEVQNNYQSLLERIFSGGYRNPANRPVLIEDDSYSWTNTSSAPAMSNFPGLATFIPERSAIKGSLPFGTNFSLGNGDRYNYKGKKTFGTWYNMSAQDVVPTYRWLVYKSGTTVADASIQPAFTHADSYMGGSSLQLKGNATAEGTDIILYRTKLEAGINPVAKVAVKWAEGKAGASATHLSVILQKKGSNDWIVVPVGETADKMWKENQVAVGGLAPTDTITRIGLRVQGAMSNYNLYVGKLELNNDTRRVPSHTKDLVVEVKEETTQSLSVKMSWALAREGADRIQYGMTYNDEQNVDHFELVYKNGENGAPVVIGTTTSWAAYLGNKVFDSADEQPYFGVRAVSTDLKTYSEIEWVAVPRTAGVPNYVETSYGTSTMNPSSDGAAVARAQRYLTSVSTEGADKNLAYTASAPDADGDQYVDATADHELEVQQGQQITLKFKAAEFGDGLKWCIAKAYLDLDESKTFDSRDITAVPDSGECIFNFGTPRAGTPEFQNPGVGKQFTIPTDARPGKSRLRLVFSDAWFAHPGPTGYTAKGFSIDFAVNITGNNTPRPKPADLHDAGTAEAPENMVATGLADVAATGVSEAVREGDVLRLRNVEKAWLYDAAGKFVKFVGNNPVQLDLTGLTPGVYVVKMQNKSVIRSTKFVK